MAHGVLQVDFIGIFSLMICVCSQRMIGPSASVLDIINIVAEPPETFKKMQHLPRYSGQRRSSQYPHNDESQLAAHCRPKRVPAKRYVAISIQSRLRRTDP